MSLNKPPEKPKREKPRLTFDERIQFEISRFKKTEEFSKGDFQRAGTAGKHG